MVRLLPLPMLGACVLTAGAQTQFATLPRPGTPQGPASMFGAWGNEAQCRAHRDGVETNPALLPYVINNQWLRQGFIYRYLTWRGQESQNGITRAWSDARCGEDDMRDYRLLLELRDRHLSIRWSNDYTVSGLRSCRS